MSIRTLMLLTMNLPCSTLIPTIIRPPSGGLAGLMEATSKVGLDAGVGAPSWPLAARQAAAAIPVPSNIMFFVILVFRRFLNMIDNQNLNRAFSRLELQTELFLQGRVDRRPTGAVVRRKWFHALFGSPGLALIRCPLQIEIENSLDPGAIRHGAAQPASERVGEP